MAELLMRLLLYVLALLATDIAVVTPTPTIDPTPTPATVDVGIDYWLTEGGWPEYLHTEAKSVAWCESRHTPGAVGDHGASLGLFQLWHGWFTYYGTSPWSDPVVNAHTAWLVYQYSGNTWRQWTCKP